RWFGRPATRGNRSPEWTRKGIGFMRARARGRLGVSGVGIALGLCMAWTTLPAQLVITEDTVITETVPSGIHIEGGATVRIAPGGRVEGNITGEPGAGGVLIIDGGVVNGSI